MPKKRFLTVIIISLIVLLFAGCNKDDGSTKYLTLMTVPTEATIPAGLHLDSILSITNPIPDDPSGATTTIQFGVFGFTNIAGEPVYYVYGKKEAISEGQSHLIGQGFYQVEYQVDEQNVHLALKNSSSALTKVDRGDGITTAYDGELPFAFYTPVEGLNGFYSFVDADGVTQFRVYATFLNKNGNFFPATEDGQMIAGSLPINRSMEETLHAQGQGGVSNLITTPITCANIPTSFVI